MKSLIEECLADVSLCRYIKSRARIASRMRQSSLDVEDVEQDMWEALIKSMPLYDGQVTLHEYCLSKVFSKYGNIVNPKSALAHFENTASEDCFDYLGRTDVAYEKVNINMVLDQIEDTLRHEANKRKQYRIALSSIQLQREGFSQSQTADLIGISKPYMRNIMMRTRRDLLKLVG